MPNNNPSGKGGFADHPEHINREGGPPGPRGINLLREAMEKRAIVEGKTLFEIFIELAYKDKTVLIEAMKKLVPNAQAIEINGQMTLKDFFAVMQNKKDET